MAAFSIGIDRGSFIVDIIGGIYEGSSGFGVWSIDNFSLREGSDEICPRNYLIRVLSGYSKNKE